jgi:transcriptional regulator with XRE-family HTH domain
MGTSGDRLRDERKRLGKTQDEFASVAGITRRPYGEWEKGETAPDAKQLAALALAGADVQYIVTGERRGQGLGESAVHQAVLDAVDLLSLGKKLDADQLALAVVKLCARHAAPPPSPASVTAIGGNAAGRDVKISKRVKRAP